MHLKLAALGILAFLCSALLTAWVRRLALARGLLDMPNPRSSHSRPVPRGGGLAVFLTFDLALLALIYTDRNLEKPLALALLLGGALVAGIGLLDDRWSLRPGPRLLAQLAAALLVVALLGPLPVLHADGHLIRLGVVGYVVSLLGVLWVLNLFNFMDGIDGLAASEAVFAGLAGAWLTGATGPAAVAAILAAASAGFLLWNWPPARIFLGDVGSGFIGFVIAVLALASARHEPASLWVWLLLGGAFVGDATVTLVRRLLRRQALHEAHREHAYQHLARRLGSHAKVTWALWALNVLWLLPCAVLARSFPAGALGICAAGLAVVVVLVWALGAGRTETSPVRSG